MLSANCCAPAQNASLNHIIRIPIFPNEITNLKEEQAGEDATRNPRSLFPRVPAQKSRQTANQR
jgi:hypothetical protein